MTKTRLPRLFVVGPLTGGIPGGLPTQGEFLAAHLRLEGYSVYQTSCLPNRYLRLADIVRTLLIQRKLYDTVILQVYSGAGFLLSEFASLISKLVKKRLILHLHGGNLPLFSRKYSFWVKKVFQRADRIVAPSNYLTYQLQWLGFPIEKIPNILDIEKYPFSVRSKIKPGLFWMRGFHEIYNPALAIKVLANILTDFPDAILTMAGPDKGLENNVRLLARELGVFEHINFAGFLDDAEKLAFGQQNNVYLNTNRIDNTPVTVLEMAALGLPVVATCIGGIPYLLSDKVNALLVPDDDALAMSKAVRCLLEDPILTERLSRNGRELAEQSSWQRVGALWNELLQSY